MTQPPSPFDPQFAAPGAGREYTFGQLLKIALRQFWHNKWRVLWVGLVVSLLLAAVRVILNLTIQPLALSGVAGSWTPGRVTVLLLALFLVRLLATVLTVPLMEGYKWATIRSFAQPRMRWADVFVPLRRPWTRTVLLFVLVLGTFHGLAGIAWWGWSQLVSGNVAAGPSEIWQRILMIFVAAGGSMLALFAVRLLTFLVLPVVFAGGRPRLGDAFRENLRIIRGQPGRVLATVGIWVALELLAGVAVGIVLSLVAFAYGPAVFVDMTRSGYWLAASSVLYGVVRLVSWVVGLHLVAVVFRAAYGMPLEHQLRAPVPGMSMPVVRPARSHPAEKP